MVNTVNITMPDGTVFRDVPENTPRAQVLARYNAIKGTKAPSASAPVSPPAAPKETWTGDVGGTLSDLAQHKINPITGAIQLLGKGVAKPAGDALGKVVGAVASGVGDAAKTVAPKTTAAISNEAATLLRTKTGQNILSAIRHGGKLYDQMAKKYPEETKTIESIGDIASFLPFGEAEKGGQVLLKTGEKAGSFAEKAGNAVVKTGEKAATAQRTKFITDLVMPAKTPEEIAKNSTVHGMFATSTPNVDKRTVEVANEVSKLPEVTNKKTIQQNLNAVREANSTEARNLKDFVAKHDVPVTKEEVDTALNDLAQKLENEPVYKAVTGSTAGNASNMMQSFLGFFDKQEKTASGLLQARKDFDNYIQSQKGHLPFDPKLESALSIPLREIRQTINGIVAEKIPDAHVLQSLRKQSNLFKAVDDMAPKAAAEGRNLIQRVANKVMNLIPNKTEGKKIIAELGIGGLGVAAVGAKPAAALAGAGTAAYLGGKALTSPDTRIAVGKLIRLAGHATRTAAASPLARSLRVDRAALIKYMRDVSDNENQ